MMNLSMLDPEKLAAQISGTDPIATLTSLGMSITEASAAAQGDFSMIGNNLKPMELDFNVIMENYGKYFNRKLIEYFFIKAKNSEQFTEDEKKSYFEAYKHWFEFVFNIGKLNLYCLDDLPESRCLTIRFDNNYYGMIIVNNQYFIMYLPDYINPIN